MGKLVVMPLLSMSLFGQLVSNPLWEDKTKNMVKTQVQSAGEIAGLMGKSENEQRSGMKRSCGREPYPC
jgi:hypothetical protein